jgi:hypothetical protein
MQLISLAPVSHSRRVGICDRMLDDGRSYYFLDTSEPGFLRDPGRLSRVRAPIVDTDRDVILKIIDAERGDSSAANLSVTTVVDMFGGLQARKEEIDRNQ